MSRIHLVNIKQGTKSVPRFSAGNTLPLVQRPFGMAAFAPQTERNGSWFFHPESHSIEGIRLTHQPSPWINDYGQFAIMPVRDAKAVDQDSRASWFTHNSEVAKPFYYQVYLADHDINAEIAPTDRAASLQFTFPESETSGIVVDAYNEGSFIKVIPELNAVVGYTTKNCGGVPENFRNWFVVVFDKPIEGFEKM